MEGAHGIDVSWLHHSPKDHHKSKKALVEEKPVQASDPVSSPSISNGTSIGHTHSIPASQHHLPPDRSPLQNSGSVKDDQTSPMPTKGSKESRGQMGRRNSWMSSFSSKFSSNSSTSGTQSGAESSSGAKPSRNPQNEQTSPVPDNPSTAKDFKRPESPTSTPPASPKAHTFLQSALRRLSSSGGGSIGKAAGNGGVCPRKTMNIDPYRERCALPVLNPAKLRRVAFCVDVEIAGSAQYVDDVLDQSKSESFPESSPSLMTREEALRSKKAEQKQQKKDQKLKRSEGEALKRPDVIVDKKSREDVVAIENGHAPAPETLLTETPATHADQNEPQKECSKKKEKKKRSEGERKERKERKLNEAIASGSIPAEIKSDGSGDSGGAETPPKSQERPTTDPLRIYRRCCALRETQPLKRVIEQISSLSACSAITPDIVSVLDLSGYWMQLHDVITLGDYLAVVPVKKIILEDCGLGDEAVRVLLAGLLAVKTPEQARHNKELKKSAHLHNDSTERLGVVEKVSFKNNPKISADGWRHIALFIYMSRSLKAIDLSLVPFPEDEINIDDTKVNQHSSPPGPLDSLQSDMPTLFQKAIAERLGGNRLEELVMAECGLRAHSIGQIVDGVIKCGITRLGLASNSITGEGFEHIMRFLRNGVCEGLDIGGNDVHQHMDMLAEALDAGNTLWALCLADCQLVPSSLERLLPALVKMPNCRFIDLSRNRHLFASRPSALGILRKYLPKFPMLKRMHLMDVDMTSEHAIALAETLPECRPLAHLNILENRLLSPLASAKSEADQEEACALYASLMAAVRVSESIICIDFDVPSPDSSEIVKALAKQVVAYSLRNLERLPLSDVTSDIAASSMTEPHGGEKSLTVPDVLLHLVGHSEDDPSNHDHDQPAPDDDYIVGGTGVVKALDICLNRAERGRTDSVDHSQLPSGSGTPRTVLKDGELSKGKAKEMSKSLLESARKIRARLQPALIQEAKAGNDMSSRRLQFLDTTLQNMIQRFENEYPETRPHPPTLDFSGESLSTDSSLHLDQPEQASVVPDTHLASDTDQQASIDPEGSPLIRPASVHHRTSSPSLASRQAQEEGRMHRFGQRVKRDILRPQTQDYAHGTTGHEEESEQLKELRVRLESFGGDEIKKKVEQFGPEAVFNAIGANNLELMAQWEREDPERFEQAIRARDGEAG